MVEHLPNLYKTMDLITSAAKGKEEEKNKKTASYVYMTIKSGQKKEKEGNEKFRRKKRSMEIKGIKQHLK